ncbi:hypothetical protein ACJIZ3_023561 [Penstemon smallii]|uniref:Uncharacterized protein n=1 Tax=Penstemon smallii TaxID=265156 RepID=A0ABD3TPL1_9LAMI
MNIEQLLSSADTLRIFPKSQPSPGEFKYVGNKQYQSGKSWVQRGGEREKGGKWEDGDGGNGGGGGGFCSRGGGESCLGGESDRCGGEK